MRINYPFFVFFAALLCWHGTMAQEDDGYVPQGFNFVGVSDKTFSVSDTKKVHFSRGNLQYNAVQDKWRFAPRQYVTACGDNANIAQDYDGWIDLFAWGTSGWSESGATNYQPWSTSGTMGNYIVGGNATISITGDYANADWGVYNRITNGGNKAGMWRTLTKEEWSYLVGSSAARNQKWGFATIHGIYKGTVILPDEWTTPNGLSFTYGRSNLYATNKYTMSEWQQMEAAGAVFLPAAGYRSNLNVKNFGAEGDYWSSSARDDMDDGVSLSFSFRSNTFTTGSTSNRGNGYSVRLVRDSRESRGEAFDEDGASYKRFSVSDTSTVRFSKGNLQYNAVQNVWRFAGKQYIYVGEANTNAAQDYNGWIDKFGWGTSGWNSGANAYQPWDTSSAYSDYYPGGSSTNNLTGEYSNADWGVYNRINNGGNKARQWRVLTKDEWSYLIGNNAQRSGKYGLATIRGTSKSYTGVVLLPDDWTLPSDVTFTAGYENGFTTNTYTMAQWEKMEAAGALFLPAAGYRHITSLIGVGTGGQYWSSNYKSDYYSWYMNFSGTAVNMGNNNRFGGAAVRLVKD